MGRWLNLFLSKEIAQLKAFRETLTNPKEIAAVDKKIKALEKKESEKQ